MRVHPIFGISFSLIMASFSIMETCAQDSTQQEKKNWLFEGYVEAYFALDFSKPSDHLRPPFLYNHNRAGEVNINLAYLRGSYSGDRFRANLALGAGTYMNANYAAEPGTLQFLLEANAGIRLLKDRKLWLELGVLPSHLGFESAASLDCWTLSRSMVAENSPYFETGAKLSYENARGTWTFNLLALNGWQTIQKVSGNGMLSWGAQAQFRPNAKWMVNYSNFLGTIYPDSARKIRHYHNVYGRWQPSSKWGMIAGFDYGFEQKTKKSGEWNSWYTPVIIARYIPSRLYAMAVRLEYFSDPAAIVIIHPGTDAFKTTGLSFNLDYMPVSYAALRMEYRWLHGQNPVFAEGNSLVTNNHSILLSLALRLQ